MKNKYDLNYVTINNSILKTIKVRSKNICYEICNSLDELFLSEYLKTGLGLIFNELYESQINAMAKEINEYFIILNNYYTSAKDINDFEQAYIDNYKTETSVTGMLKYIVNKACRLAFIEKIDTYKLMSLYC